MWKKEWKRSQENLCHLGSQCLLHLTWISWEFCIQFRKWLGLSSLQVPYPEMCPLGRGNPRSCAGDCGYEDLMLEPEQDLHARELHGREGHLKAHPGNPQMCFSRDLACRSYHRSQTVWRGYDNPERGGYLSLWTPQQGAVPMYSAPPPACPLKRPNHWMRVSESVCRPPSHPLCWTAGGRREGLGVEYKVNIF